LVCAGCGEREASVYASVRSAQIRVDSSRLSDLAEVKVAAQFYRDHDGIVLHGGWLTGDDGALVARLGLTLPKVVPNAMPNATIDETELVNQSVTNGSLVALCDLQLDIGVTVSGVRDRERTMSLGFPVKVRCD
jgi:hypothetical protein